MIQFPTAKINIGLNVTKRRADGFHDIQSVFVPVALKDALEIIEHKTGVKAVEFTSSGIDIPGKSDDNLCCKAYYLIAADYPLPNVKIHLHKNIPIGAGLGGGSADAAYVILLLNDMFALNMTESQMENYAKKLGSDCPFFVRNKIAYVEGTGTELEPFSLDLEGYYIALVNPNIHINTGKAYGKMTPKLPSKSLNEALKVLPMTEWRTAIHNDFEDVVFLEYPEIKEIKEKLYQHGASYAAMSGSGSTVYGIFKKATDITSLFPSYFVWSGAL